MSRRDVTCTIRQQSGEFTGPAGAIRLAVQVAGARSMRSPRSRDALLVALEDVGDVVAALEYGQRRDVVIVNTTGRPVPPATRAVVGELW